VTDALRELFAAPWAAAALPAVPLLVWWLARRERRRAQRLARVAGARVARLAAEVDARRRRAQRLAFGAGLACLVLACMQPRWGAVVDETIEPGVDVIVCLDVSRSMLARDVAPSRLLRAQSEIEALAARARGDRFGLVAFAGEARLVVPLTRDAETFAQLARATDPVAVRIGGTDLGQAIDVAVAALAAGRGRGEGDALDGAIVLLTDGEDFGGGGRAAAQRAAERGVRVHCVGFGSALGSKITVDGADGREEFLRARGGDEVVSALDARGLRAIAAAGGGVFADAGERADALVAVHEGRVVPQARAAVRRAAGEQKRNRHRVPLALALALLLCELALSDRRRAR
jgi:Ca-activated chloride channel family protein